MPPRTELARRQGRARIIAELPAARRKSLAQPALLERTRELSLEAS